MKVSLDIMGGDQAPEATIGGAVLAFQQGIINKEDIVLVGPSDVIGEELAKHGFAPDHFPIKEANQVVGMGENPAEALRKKTDSSIFQAAQQVLEKKAGALVSAGNTGAAVACAVRLWRTLPKVRRPGIAVTVSGSIGKPVTVIDMGANVSCKPNDLLTYACMATAYSRDSLGIKNPRVGLINIGAEGAKGNALTKETFALFQKSTINFVGNVEGQDIYAGTCDVVVCDGFVGNVVLKLSEGLSQNLLRSFKNNMGLAGIDPEIQRTILGQVKKGVDYSEYGGALLLGVDGICVICHGHSDAKAVSNAIKLAIKAIDTGLNQHINETIEADLNLAGETNELI